MKGKPTIYSHHENTDEKLELNESFNQNCFVPKTENHVQSIKHGNRKSCEGNQKSKNNYSLLPLLPSLLSIIMPVIPK